MGLTTEEIVAQFDKKYKKYEAAEKFMDTLQENGFEMDEFIQEQLKCIKDVKDEMLDKENARVGTESVYFSESIRERRWKEMNNWKGFLDFSEERKESIRNFFEKMNTTIVKAEGFKECYEVFYETLTSRNQLQVDRWQARKRTLEYEIADLGHNLGYEPTYENIYKDINLSKAYIEKLQQKVQAGQGNEIENDERKVSEELEYQKEELKVLESKFARFETMVADAKTLKEEMNSRVVKGAVVDKVSILHEFTKLHKGNHKDSKEFKRMEAAFKIVEGWGSPEIIGELTKWENPPTTLQDALGVLKREADNYLKEKKEQWRPFPSELRTSRMTTAEMISGYVDSWLEDLQVLPPEKMAQINQPTKDAIAQSKEAAKNAPEFGQRMM